MLIFLLAYLLFGIFLAIGSYQDDRDALAVGDHDFNVTRAMKVAFFVVDTLFLPFMALANKVMQFYMYLERTIVEKF